MSSDEATAPQDQLVERLRDLLVSEPTTREISMFGGRAFMVDDRIVVSAWKRGDLLVRVDPSRTDELLALPGAVPAEMGSGRRMGAGWITVERDAITDDGPLSDWLARALEYDAPNSSRAIPRKRSRRIDATRTEQGGR